ncbi:hypothetical protein NON20_19185 [Synechocystis sp. B12]|nr:hypothetical protein NON20_19185 [Synechocystis sp. B12]
MSCGRCQTTWVVSHVTSRHQSKAYLYLRPRHCPEQPKCQAIAYGQLLEQVIEQICQQLPLAVAQLSPSSLGTEYQHLQQAIVEKQSLLEQLPTWEQRGVLDSHTHQLRRYQLKQGLSPATTTVGPNAPGRIATHHSCRFPTAILARPVGNGTPFLLSGVYS